MKINIKPTPIKVTITGRTNLKLFFHKLAIVCMAFVLISLVALIIATIIVALAVASQWIEISYGDGGLVCLYIGILSLPLGVAIALALSMFVTRSKT